MTRTLKQQRQVNWEKLLHRWLIPSEFLVDWDVVDQYMTMTIDALDLLPRQSKKFRMRNPEDRRCHGIG